MDFSAGPADTRVLLLVIGVAWSALLALARRALTGLERKIDDNARKVAELQGKVATMIGDTRYRIERNFRDLVEESRRELKELDERLGRAVHTARADTEKLRAEQLDRLAALSSRMTRRLDEARLRAVSQQEFRLFTANLNHKVESIYRMILDKGAND